MKLTIGENIRNLRREKNITQEEFATIFGVTYQSVSRWENDSCYPDIELLPDIAEFFGITVDKLIGSDKGIEQKEVEKYLERFQEAVSRGAVYECIDIARKGVAEYPNNYALLNKLMYALFMSGDEDGNIPEWKENMAKNDAEITALGERIMKYCPDVDIRFEATERLAFNHCEMGRKEIGRRIYESLPSIWYCREMCIRWGLEESETRENAHTLIRRGYEVMQHGMFLLRKENSLSNEEKITIMEKTFELDILMNNKSKSYIGWGSSKDYCFLAGKYVLIGKYDKAFEALSRAAELADAFDNRPEIIETHSLLLGNETHRRTDFDTDDTRTLCEIMRDKWLASSDFDGIRNTPEFKEIISKLS